VLKRDGLSRFCIHEQCQRFRPRGALRREQALRVPCVLTLGISEFLLVTHAAKRVIRDGLYTMA